MKDRKYTLGEMEYIYSYGRSYGLMSSLEQNLKSLREKSWNDKEGIFPDTSHLPPSEDFLFDKGIERIHTIFPTKKEETKETPSLLIEGADTVYYIAILIAFASYLIFG